LPSAIKLTARHAVFAFGFRHTVPSHPLSCHGTRTETWRVFAFGNAFSVPWLARTVPQLRTRRLDDLNRSDGYQPSVAPKVLNEATSAWTACASRLLQNIYAALIPMSYALLRP
jgi:hypothetical protein